jgi:hypothetical protein
MMNDPMGRRQLIAVALLLSLAPYGRATAQDAEADSPSRSEPVPIVLVIGAAGTPEYAKQFAAWADRWSEVAEQSGAQLTRLGDGESDTPDRDVLQKAVNSLSADGPTPAWIVLIGHGTYARNVAKFNLRGRDVSATELAEWLEPLSRPVVVVDCASASGPFVNRLSGTNRIVVTATKSGTEQNFSRFGKFFAAAVSSPDSDLDHDDEVSVFEAFLSASDAVEQFYESEDRISTEHALLDDNGDGKGTPSKMFRGARAIGSAKDGTELDGKRASRITLALSENRLELTSDELAQRDGIERQLDELRGKKNTLEEQEYESQLEPLLIRMARIYRAAERRD